MNQGVVAESHHESLTKSLKACCKDCPFTSSNRACSKAKTNCCFYNLTIAEFVLASYSEKVLEKIPVEQFVRGIKAHHFTGELKQTKTFTI